MRAKRKQNSEGNKGMNDGETNLLAYLTTGRKVGVVG